MRIEPTWKTLGMRNTASHDVVLENVLVAEGAVTLRRPAGKWHPLFDLLCLFSLPLVYAVYLGVAQAARDRALEMVRKRKTDEVLLQQIGEMENQLARRAARARRLDRAAPPPASPGRESTSRSMTDRTLVARGVLGTVEAAMSVAGGAAFFRATASSSSSAMRRARASIRCRRGRRRRLRLEPRSASRSDCPASKP